MIELKFDKRFLAVKGAFTLDVSLQAEDGAFIVLSGPSGAGKSTLLRCLAGLVEPDSGYLHVNGEVWFDHAARIRLPTQRRKVGYMFQDYALFPNMTVRGNLEFALRKGGGKKRVDELIGMMELGELQQRKPDTLSGGQKQRVALARALIAEPRLLLLDEPLSALDPAIRLRLQDELLAMHRHFGLTTIMVSHDVSEVYKLAQCVVMMENGRIARQGTPAEVFRAGQSSGKFCFTGEVLAIEPVDVVFAVTVLVGNQVVRVVASTQEVAQLKVGSRVMLLAKAFNPMLKLVE
ncbi:MAG: ATP-binding cassette domain-containing protein [Nitrosomonadales bacterium]|nr:MAG: ATP-binding cassette domain-containing protein [Nitrosomonadales bacterium]